MTSAPISGRNPTRLLLVEDYAPLAEATEVLLREAGLGVRIAGFGEEALLAAIEFRPDIVLCDMHLPDMSGLDVARALRANPDTKNALLAIHTSMSETEIRVFEREIHSDEVNLFVSKPLTEEKVGRLLAELAVVRRAAA